jgi:hypothetical protein
VPYLKFSRDKRGYEHFSIIEPGVVRRGKPSRPRLLFWFRSPPQVKVGRLPFTDEVRRAIEEQNPNVRFDWPRLLATPIPPPDVEHWRERRRIEKAAKQAAREAEAGDLDEVQEVQGVQEVQEVQEVRGVQEVQESRDGDDKGELEPAVEASETSESGESVTVTPPTAGAERSASGGRRRRRRGRRKHRPAGETPPEEAKPITPVPPTDEV